MNNLQKILLFNNALAMGEDALKKQRHADGLWRGHLSSSAVSTAVAAFALPFKLNILVAIAAAVALCLMLEKTATVPKASA